MFCKCRIRLYLLNFLPFGYAACNCKTDFKGFQGKGKFSWEKRVGNDYSSSQSVIYRGRVKDVLRNMLRRSLLMGISMRLISFIPRGYFKVFWVWRGPKKSWVGEWVTVVDPRFWQKISLKMLKGIFYVKFYLFSLIFKVGEH